METNKRVMIATYAIENSRYWLNTSPGLKLIACRIISEEDLE